MPYCYKCKKEREFVCDVFDIWRCKVCGQELGKKMKGKEYKFNLTLKQRLRRLFRAIFSIPIVYSVDGKTWYYAIEPLDMYIEEKIINIEEAIKGYWIGVRFE